MSVSGRPVRGRPVARRHRSAQPAVARGRRGRGL